MAEDLDQLSNIDLEDKKDPPDAEDSALQILIQQVKTTIAKNLDEEILDNHLINQIINIKEWKNWSEHAKSAYAHMCAAQFMHNVAVGIKKEHKMDFAPVTGESYKKLFISWTARVRF